MGVSRSVLVLLLMVALVACAPQATTGAPPTETSIGSLDLETWCAEQTAGRCVEGLAYLDLNPGQETCVFTAPASDRAFWELCAEPQPATEPVTTIPTPESEAQRLADEAAFREEMERRLPVLDAQAAELLASTHPNDMVEVGLVFAEPLSLTAAEQTVAGYGADLIAAWRTDYVCLPGWEELPLPRASRFAYLDGVERAARLQQEMDNSTTPVTGRHIPMNSFAVMAQEAQALREPGVLLEAVQVEVPIARVDDLTSDPAVSRVRLVGFPTEWVDFSDLPLPECPEN